MKHFKPFDITLTRRKNGDYYGPLHVAARRFCEEHLHLYFDFPQDAPVIHLHVTPRPAKSRYKITLTAPVIAEDLTIVVEGEREFYPYFYEATQHYACQILEELLEDSNVYVGLEYDDEP